MFALKLSHNPTQGNIVHDDEEWGIAKVKLKHFGSGILLGTRGTFI